MLMDRRTHHRLRHHLDDDSRNTAIKQLVSVRSGRVVRPTKINVSVLLYLARSRDLRSVPFDWLLSRSQCLLWIPCWLSTLGALGLLSTLDHWSLDDVDRL